jgi:hypothetical protein
VASKYHSSLKETMTPWRNDWGRKSTRQEELHVSKSKEVGE